MSMGSAENLVFGKHATAPLRVEHRGGNRYRIVDPQISLVDPAFGYFDTIEADRDPTGNLIVRSLVEPGEFYVKEFPLDANWRQDQSAETIFAQVRELGGAWHVSPDDLLIVWLPNDTDADSGNDLSDDEPHPAVAMANKANSAGCALGVIVLVLTTIVPAVVKHFVRQANHKDRQQEIQRNIEQQKREIDRHNRAIENIDEALERARQNQPRRDDLPNKNALPDIPR